MIGILTKWNVCDNTGVRKIFCIGYLGKKKRALNIGQIFVGVIKSTTPNNINKKGDRIYALIIRTKRPFLRHTGHFIHFLDNACILLNKDKSPKGTRISGLMLSDLALKGFPKCVSMAKHII